MSWRMLDRSSLSVLIGIHRLRRLRRFRRIELLGLDLEVEVVGFFLVYGVVAVEGMRGFWKKLF